MKNIVEYLEKTSKDLPDKTAIIDADGKCISFRDLWSNTKAIAAALFEDVHKQQPVLICMEKGIECIESFMAVALLGAYYIPIDITLPFQRIKYIIDTVSAKIVIARRNDNIPEQLATECVVLFVEDLISVGERYLMEGLDPKRNVLATDPLYAIFTSGSTGVPKGVITSHQALFSFIDEMGERFHFTSEDTLANQVPFYFDASTKDIYLMCKYGCTMCIVPQKLFMMPVQLIEFLNRNNVTRVIWAPSLLCIVARMKTLEKYVPESLKTVFFVGEAMPAQQYNTWKKYLPDIEYVNLYGSTEVTGSSMYYTINREIDNSEQIPIGEPFGNVEVFLIDDHNHLVTEPNITGEICVKGLSLSLGYFGDFEKTRGVFVQNPLNDNWGETVFRSGDIGKYNEFGELVYVCRKDFQIKRMGRRIELGDIEAMIGSVEGVDRVCCLFNEEKQQIIAIISGPDTTDTIVESVKNNLPSYMHPSVYNLVESMPLNANGKIDRNKLKQIYLGGEKK